MSIRSGNLLAGIVLTTTLTFSSAAQAGVTDFSKRFSVALTAVRDVFGLNLSPTGNPNATPVNYNPNTTTASGIQVTAFGLTLAYRNTAAVSPKDEKLYGSTSYEDIRGAISLGAHDQWMVVGYYNRYSGLYIGNSSAIDATYIPGESYMIRPDVSIFNSGLGVIYVFSPEKFSLAAAVLQSAKQTESDGSFLIMGSFDGTLFSATDPLVPSQVHNQYGIDATLSRGEFSTASLSGGYGYTLTKWSFFLTGVVMLGGGYQWRNYHTANGNYNGVVNASKATLGLSLGYNGDTLFIGASMINNTTEYPTSSVRLRTELNSVRSFIGLRF